MRSYEKIFNDFWKPLLYRNGKLNLTQVKKELADYYFIMEEVPKVYCHITNNRLSKILYPSKTVIAEADQALNEAIDEAIEEYQEEHG